MERDEKKTSSVGERLKEHRTKKNLDIEIVSRMLHVPADAIAALESDDYGHFSAKVYASGILRKLSSHLGIPDTDNLVQEFATEWDIKNFHAHRELKPLPENRGDTPFLTPKRIRVIVAVIALLFLLGYVGYRVFAFVREPELLIETPEAAESRFGGRILPIEGRVERESHLTVNGREITIDEEGRFSDTVELKPNLNILEFVATNRFGKKTVDTRYVMVE